jgi:uncharacterized protein (TIGR03067 family)
MRLLALLAAGLLAGTALAAPVPKEKEKVKDEDGVLGVWAVDTFDYGEIGGPPQAEAAKMRMTFKKEGKLVLALGGEPQDASYKLDPTAKPKGIDLSSPALGIYELDGDTLKLCLSQGPSQARPTEFKADGKRGVLVITLKRVKDEKKDEKKDK